MRNAGGDRPRPGARRDRRWGSRRRPGGELADGIRQAWERDALVRAGLERAAAFSWRATAERTVAVYREAVAR